MTQTELLQTARESFRHFLQTDGQSPNWQETVLIAGGFYRGRRFRSDRHSAVWMADDDLLQICRADGTPVKRISLAPAAMPLRRAA